jgi:hypothetical protein
MRIGIGLTIEHRGSCENDQMAKSPMLLGRIADPLEHLADKATGVRVDAVELVDQRHHQVTPCSPPRPVRAPGAPPDGERVQAHVAKTFVLTRKGNRLDHPAAQPHSWRSKSAGHRTDSLPGTGCGAWHSPPIRSGNAILLIAGDKSGVSQARLYKPLITTADARHAAHLKRIGS